MDVDHPPQAIVITSPRQGDGKSTTAVNLAAAIALSGRKVTLIDADLRRPTLATLLGLDDSVGLTDVLASRLGLADVVQHHPEIVGLSVLTTGNQPPNPSELLGSKAMRSLIASLAKKGMVVIDAPPLLPVTDAAILGHAADGALLTVSAGSTLDHELQAALGHLEHAQAKVLGVVLNRVSRKTAGSGYQSYYGYDEANR
jgi:capsular exopolysaccharide synthesis family protein